MNFSPPNSRRNVTVWLLVLAALIVPVLQAIIGIRYVNPQGAYDGPFALSAFIQFKNELLVTHALPRWIMGGHAGLGSPLFYFYPPGAYAFTTAVSLIAPAMAPTTMLAVAEVTLRILSILACALWLQKKTDGKTALLGGALYALMPYVAIINPQVRLAFAETAAAPLLPLVFLAADWGKGRAVPTLFVLAPVMALLALTHLPSTVLAGGLVVAYMFFLPADTIGRRIFHAAIAVAGSALGLAIAAIAIAPALQLLPEISSFALTSPGLLPENGFLLAPQSFHSFSSLFINANIALVMVFIGFLMAPAGKAIREDAQQRAVFCVLIVAVLLTLPVSMPLWLYVPPLRSVQFPSRLMQPIALFTAALLVILYPQASERIRRAILLLGFMLFLIACAIAFKRGDHMQPGAAQTEEALKSPGVDASEYMPKAAGQKGWFGFSQFEGGDLHKRAAEVMTGCMDHRPLPETRTAQGLLFDVRGCSGTVVLPQFYFPGWLAEGKTPLAVMADPASGLVSVTISQNTDSLLLSRATLPIETLAVRISLAALVLWFFLGAYCLYTRFTRVPMRVKIS